jgi:hypothetical protein
VTFKHWAGVTAYTAPCGFARCCVFGKQSLPPGLCHPPQLEPQGFHQKGSSFFRSYGGNLPSSLTIVLPLALVFSTRPPVSVWGTGTVPTHCWAFLGSMESVTSRYVARHHVSALRLQLSSEPAYTLTPGLPSPGFTYPPASPVNYPPASSVGSLPEGNSPNVAALGPGAGTVVLEYQPVVHRLRLSASP